MSAAGPLTVPMSAITVTHESLDGFTLDGAKLAQLVRAHHWRGLAAPDLEDATMILDGLADLLCAVREDGSIGTGKGAWLLAWLLRIASGAITASEAEPRYVASITTREETR